MDADGMEFGPYAASVMRDWYDRNEFGVFSDRLLVRLPEWEFFISLIDLYDCKRGSYFVATPSLPSFATSFPDVDHSRDEPQRDLRNAGADTYAAFLQTTTEPLIESAASTSRRERTSKMRVDAKKSFPRKWCCPMLNMSTFMFDD
eukprot:TRINITY_DN4579_c1_g1_i2.p1 TRINITY_DN4579_c1_g1~~TRINITY_DN4579_c1_g1_i2.p1  ORF type:complete len:160 (-),score=22.17 TRINITY_DN4579_c1_g1_i2:252-689(-)